MTKTDDEKNNMIHLEKIDSTNIWEIVDLKVFKSQKTGRDD